jgi:hypothetical protein
MTYTMMDVLPVPDYKVVLSKGQFNGIRAHYNIRMDPDLGMGWEGVRSAAVAHARINSKGRGCCAATSPHSHATG